MEEFDIEAAYLNSHLSEEIYMTIPKRFPDEERSCKLRKVMYGLRQASQVWIVEFESFMRENNS